jgi:hypothetical protein
MCVKVGVCVSCSMCNLVDFGALFLDFRCVMRLFGTSLHLHIDMCVGGARARVHACIRIGCR